MAKWQGTVVPNSGYVENVYFNTNLSVDEVVSLLSKLNYTSSRFIDIPIYGLLYKHTWINNEWVDLILSVFKFDDLNYAIVDFDNQLTYFVTENVPDMPLDFVGWNPSLNSEVIVNGDVSDSLQDISFGTQNNLLTSLFSTTPFTQSQPTIADKLQKLVNGKQYVVDKTNAKAGSDLKINSTWQSIGDVIEGIESGGGINVPSVSNLSVSDNGVASWEAPVLSLPSDYQYSLEYIISVNDSELDSITETSKNISSYLVVGENIISVVVKATLIINSDETSISYEYSAGEYTIIELTTTLPNTLSNTSSVSVGTNVYLFGGYGSPKAIHKFDMVNETITTLSTKLVKDSQHILCGVVGTNIYLFGGMYITDYYNKIYKFDTTTETITTLSTTLPGTLFDGTCCVVGTNIYLFGGYYNGSKSNVILKFDTTTETITTLSTTLPKTLWGLRGCVYGTNVYLFGGKSSDFNKAIYKFDTINETISSLSTATLPVGITNFMVAIIDTNIYLFGGESGTTKQNTIYKFDITTETIITLPTTLPTTLYGAGVGVFENIVYLLGGSNTDKILKFIG